jgi:hypothetical protein
MFVVFYMDVIFCQIYNLQFTTHLSHICWKKIIFWDENFQISNMVSKHGSYYVKW